MSVYELAILGGPTPEERAQLTATIAGMVEPFDLAIGTDVLIYDATSLEARDRRAAFAAAYFGNRAHVDRAAIDAVLHASSPVIPTIGATAEFEAEIPEPLRVLNGVRRRADDPGMSELAAAMLECVGLLRRQRRVFVSYRRTESRAAAVQLHDLLCARGFDVFLDTHDIRPGDPFQDVLWHRLCDSDVLVMLDTPTYFDSKWTRQEIGRARAKEIHVLRIVWPDHVPNPMTDLAETVYLDAGDLVSAEGPIRDEVIETVVAHVEWLRSRSLASRYLSITGRFRADMEKIGAHVHGVAAHRAIGVTLVDGTRVWAYPVVGVPTAELFNDVAEKARQAAQAGTPILVYDHVGMRDIWTQHLQWLDEQIRAVKAIRVAEAGWALAAWEAR